jgi:hypothetical protein
MKSKYQYILIILTIIIIGSFLFYASVVGLQTRIVDHQVTIERGKIMVYKGSFWAIGQKTEIEWSGSEEILISLMNEENFNRLTSGKSYVFLLDECSAYGSLEFTPKLGATYYLMVGNITTEDFQTRVSMADAFAYEGKMNIDIFL